MGREPGTQRLSRLLEIFLLIATQPRSWTRERLVERYELSRRQVQKDLDEIRHRLNPTLRHTRQGYHFEHVPILSPLTYSLPEALALLRAARAGMASHGVDAGDLAAALARLEAMLPPELSALLPRRTGDQVAVVATTRGARLKTLEMALAQRRQVRLRYAAASHEGTVSERLFDTYAVEPYLRGWYTIGYCHLRKEIRTFKVDRIHAVTPTDEQYTIPPDFDPAEYLGEGAAWGLMVGSARVPENVTLRFSPLAARWVREEHWHHSQRLEEQPDGSVLLHLRLAISPEFCRWVFRYGSHVQVVQPASLREWMVREAQAVLGTSTEVPGPCPT